MKQLTTPVLATFVIISLIVGVVGGYFAASRLTNNPVNQSPFQPYRDNYGGLIDDTNSGFVNNAPLVAGFSRGQIAWYWLVGPTSANVNPVYFFQYQSGGSVEGQHPIIDVKPGNSSYSHFWEIYNVTVPNSYVPNTIKSLATLSRAQSAGLVSITDSKRALNGPLVAHDVKIAVVNGEPQFLHVWYRTDIATIAVFETNLPGGGPVPSVPIWLIKRAADPCPLLEAVCNSGKGADLNGDGDFKDSNDLIDATPGQPGYFPLWAVSLLHVRNNYLNTTGTFKFPSPFPQNPTTLKNTFHMFTSLEDAQTDQNSPSPTYVDLSVGDKGLTSVGLVNCPTLPLGIEPPGILAS